jgi:hypothetical protein
LLIPVDSVKASNPDAFPGESAGSSEETIGSTGKILPDPDEEATGAVGKSPRQ